LTHIRQTLLLISSTLLVIRVLHLMMPDCSIALMFLSKWFVPLVRTPSNPKSDLRRATASSLILLLKEQLPAVAHSQPTLTPTTGESKLQISCKSHIRLTISGGSSDPLFLYLNKNKNALLLSQPN
jgi:hypothetical protein